MMPFYRYNKKIFQIILHVLVGIMTITVVVLILASCVNTDEVRNNVIEEHDIIARPDSTPLPEDALCTQIDGVDQVQRIMGDIENALHDWENCEVSYEEIVSFIQQYTNHSKTELAQYAQIKLEYIKLENEGANLLLEAREYIDKENYVAAITSLNKISKEFSNYSEVTTLYARSRDSVLQYVAQPNSLSEFDEYLLLLKKCNNIYPNALFTKRLASLKNEKAVYIEVSDIIQSASELYDATKYEESFMLLAMGLDQYPMDDRLASTLVSFHDHYIISVTRQACKKSEAEMYKEALEIVDDAIQEYDCEEFQLLKESIKRQKSTLYRVTSDLVEKFRVIAQGWDEETFDVKKATSSAGSYIMKSGKKLFLGDYADENITVLSFGGNIIASLAGVDIAFDLRDLTYDLTHWGDEEYFALYLATDVIALIPVVGVVKYLDHFQSMADGVKTSSNLAESISDVGKNTDDVLEVTDVLASVAKTGDNIIDSIDSAKDVAKKGEAAKDVLADIGKKYKRIKTINEKLIGSKHPETGVEFVMSKLKYADGRMIQGVFPKFDSLADIQLPKELYKADFNDQKQFCLKELRKKTRPVIGRLRKHFTEEQLEDIAKGIIPEGFVWHHNEKEGLMQLVDSLIHSKTSHTGGMSLWGKGYGQ